MAFRSFAILSTLVSTAWAQSQTNPLIPSSGISSACTSYLTSLNNDTGFIACTSPFTTALQRFTPGTGSSSLSIADLTTALGTLCQSDAFSACPQSSITAQLGDFYAACPAELTSSRNQAVQTLYDTLYVLTPLREAICSKDDGGNYCATQLSNSSHTGSVAIADPERTEKQALLNNFLYTSTGSGSVATRDVSNSTTALVPNITTYQDTNLVFLFLRPSMSASTLCTSCTRSIMSPYIAFESNCPYGPGRSNSLLLAGQVPLYSNITSKCGQGFLSGAVQAAGGISSGIVSNGASLNVGQELSTAVSAILGIAAFVVAAL